MKIIYKYLGTYRVFREIDLNTGEASANEDATYLLGKANSQIYRYSYPISSNDSENILAIYFPSGVSTSNIVIPKIQELGVDINLFIDCSEQIWHFKENDIHKVNEIMSFKTKGKNEQLKQKIREEKAKLKEEKLLAKQDKVNKNNK